MNKSNGYLACIRDFVDSDTRIILNSIGDKHCAVEGPFNKRPKSVPLTTALLETDNHKFFTVSKV